MKKVYDEDIAVTVYIQSCKQKVQLVCSIHTNIHEIMLKVARKLGFDPFDTRIEFYFRSHLPLKPISTLAQNGVSSGSTIVARILSTRKPITVVDPPKQFNHQPTTIVKRESEIYGLTLVCTCIEPRCINYGKDTTVSYGTGQYSFFQLINSTKCAVCPYRDQMKNPAMIVKAVELSHCVWKLDGTYLVNGFPSQHSTQFKKVAGKRHNLYEYLRKHKWQGEVTLTVKDL